MNLLQDNLRVARSGRAKKFSGSDSSELCDKSMYVKEERSQKVSGNDVSSLLLSFGEISQWLSYERTTWNPTSNVFKEPKSDNSGCNSTILLFQALITSKSLASYQLTSLVTVFRAAVGSF